MCKYRAMQALVGAVALTLLVLPPAGLRAGEDRPWHGYGTAHGMMMGPGMGYGMGPGMMGYMMGSMHGYAMGTGMGLGAVLELSDEQREQIRKIHQELRQRHWDVMGEIMDKQNEIGDLYAQETPDPGQVGQAYSELTDLGRQMIEAEVRARNRVREVLTEEQRQRLRRWHSGGGWQVPQRARPGGATGGRMMGR